ncbi:hypothetical protein C7212DRAFT_365300 [Tuber magnatum]|uniref:PiggyBac transposable element-derived protein domain-containing protein n=1 Tax=Tuber magnatum TaxID=42249 RepID=A0A317SM65_9PEZI|nr:hypothetical protein C7212DRAFT_365300 [Tuber magnatum]
MTEQRDVLYDSEEEEAEFMCSEEYLDTYRADHEEEETENERSSRSHAGNDEGVQATRRLPALPPVLEYTPLHHPTARHDRQAQFSDGFKAESPLDYFQLFFDDNLFDLLVKNTNQYAESKNAGRNGTRYWKPTSIPEMKIFFSLIIYMGIFLSAQVKNYWSRDSEFPFYCIGMYLSQNRFEQLKCDTAVDEMMNSILTCIQYK